MPQSPAFLSPSVRLAGLADVVLLLSLTGSWLGLLGRWHWILDLFSHFRWQYLLVCLLAVAWAFWKKRTLVKLAGLTTLMLNAWLLGQPNLGRTGTLDPDFKLRVVSLNVLTTNEDHDAVIDFINSADADLVFLMEVDDVWLSALKPLQNTHPYIWENSRQDNFGLAVYSKVSLQEITLLEDELKSSVPSMQVLIKHAGREFRLLGTHPLPPISQLYAKSRDLQLAAVGDWVSAIQEPMLVMGDLNATPWSHAMRNLTRSSGLRLAANAWQPTWKVPSPLAIPIDHALTTKSLIITERQIGPDVGSDHRPQIIDLGWVK
jgi:endonuclease/exonuclease/phosphatase (EEP) superfamily protein YafD